MTDLIKNPPQTNTPSEGQGADVSQPQGIDPNFSKVGLEERGQSADSGAEKAVRNDQTIIPASKS